MRYSTLLLSSSLLLAACEPNITTEQDIEQAHMLPAHESESRIMHVVRSARDSGNTESAIMLLQKVVAESKGSVVAHKELASLLEQQNKLQPAVQVLMDAHHLQPDDTEILVNLAKLLLRTNYTAKALNYYTIALTHDPDNLIALNGKGVALDKLGRHAEAVTIYRKGLAMAPNHMALNNNLALSYILAGNYQDAIALLEPITNSADASARVRQNLALAYGLEGNALKAMEINLVDLSPEQATQNASFYEHVKSTRTQTQAIASVLNQPETETDSIIAEEVATEPTTIAIAADEPTHTAAPAEMIVVAERTIEAPVQEVDITEKTVVMTESTALPEAIIPQEETREAVAKTATVESAAPEIAPPTLEVSTVYTEEHLVLMEPSAGGLPALNNKPKTITIPSNTPTAPPVWERDVTDKELQQYLQADGISVE